MKPYLLKGIAQYAFIECPDVNKEIEAIKQTLDSDIVMKVADCSALSSGKDIRLLLNQAAKDIDGAERKVLLIHGIDQIDERELNVGLGDFCSFIQAYNSHLEYPGDISYKSYDYSFNPAGLSVFVIVKEGMQKHFLKYTISETDFGFLLDE